MDEFEMEDDQSDSHQNQYLPPNVSFGGQENQLVK